MTTTIKANVNKVGVSNKNQDGSGTGCMFRLRTLYCVALFTRLVFVIKDTNKTLSYDLNNAAMIKMMLQFIKVE